MAKSKEKNKILKVVLMSLIGLVFIGFFVYLCINYDFLGIQGNSVITYSCQDSSYTLDGNMCYKTETKDAYLIGDVNKDGKITSEDADIIQNYLSLNTTLDDIQKQLADADQNKIVDVFDATHIRKYEKNLVESDTLGKKYLCEKGYSLNGNKCSKNIKQSAIKNIITTKRSNIKGDINLDGVLDEKDSELLQQYLGKKIELTDDQKKIADCDNDGDISIADVRAIQKYLSSKEEKNSNNGEIENSTDTISSDMYIKLDKSDYNLKVNEKQQIQYSSSDNLKDIKPKYNSSDVSVVSVNENGQMTAKKEGKAEIVINIGQYIKKITVTVTKEEDENINCPAMIYNKNGNYTNVEIRPDNSITNYRVYKSTSDNVGYYVTWGEESKIYEGVNTVNNQLSNGLAAPQLKIVVTNSSGKSRNCFTGPLSGFKTYSYMVNVCPTFTYSYDYSSKKSYEYKLGDSEVKSGISKMHVNWVANPKYQYMWYTTSENSDNNMIPQVSYGTSQTSMNSIVDGINTKNRRGEIVVISNNGSIAYCPTPFINNISFDKNTIGDTDVYFEEGYNEANKKTASNIIKQMYNKNASFVPTTKYFFMKNDTWEKEYGNLGICGYAINNGIYVKIREGALSCGDNGPYYKEVVVHETGHSIDQMYAKLSSNSERLTLNFDFDTYRKAHPKDTEFELYRNITRPYNDVEFWADLFAYNLINELKIDQNTKYSLNKGLNKLYQDAIKKYSDAYNKNKTTFNDYKGVNR